MKIIREAVPYTVLEGFINSIKLKPKLCTFPLRRESSRRKLRAIPRVVVIVTYSGAGAVPTVSGVICGKASAPNPPPDGDSRNHLAILAELVATRGIPSEPAPSLRRHKGNSERPWTISEIVVDRTRVRKQFGSRGVGRARRRVSAPDDAGVIRATIRP